MTPIDTVRRKILQVSTLGLTAGLPSLDSLKQKRWSEAAVFDIRSYGAIGDGKALDTSAINGAIEAAAAAGGGTIYFPAGKWLSFSIRLKSNIELYLSEGATLLAADSPLPGQMTGHHGGVYDLAEPAAAFESYQDYGHNHWHNSLIWGQDIQNISIAGPGLIYGKGLSNGRDWMPEVVPFKAEQRGVGNKAIALKNCNNVILRDFSILKGGHFGVLLTGVDNVAVDNLKIDTDRDGIDIDCCKNVRIYNCTVNSPWDDGICPKSSLALGFPRYTENVTITNCYVTGTFEMGSVLDGTWKKFPSEFKIYRTGRIKCGTESNGGFRNITISDCIFEGCEGLALESEDGAIVEDITIANITMRDNVSAPLFFRLGARLRGPKATTAVGKLRRILVTNLVSSNGGSGVCSILSGIPGHALEDIHLSHIFIEHKGGAAAAQSFLQPPEAKASYPDPNIFGPMPAQGFYLRHIRNLEMSHIEVRALQPDGRPAFCLDDVNRADLLAMTASTNHPAFCFDRVSDLRVAFSRATKDIQLDFADKLRV